MADSHADSEAGPADTDPRPAAVTFVTTKHVTLTIAEATGRATMFLGAVSGGLVALGLIATARRRCSSTKKQGHGEPPAARYPDRMLGGEENDCEREVDNERSLGRHAV